MQQRAAAIVGQQQDPLWRSQVCARSCQQRDVVEVQAQHRVHLH